MENTKRNHVARSLSKKLEILQRIEKGEKPGLLAKEFHIAPSTISTWRKHKGNIDHQANEGVKLDRKRNRVSKLPQVERALLLWFKDMRNRPGGVVLSNNMLQLKAGVFAKEFGFGEWTANAAFLWRWKKHYNIVNKAISGEKGEAPDCTDFLQTVVKPIVEEYGSFNVYNADETGFYYKMMPHRTNCFKDQVPMGYKQSKDRLTLLLFTNMNGTDKMKPIIVGKAAKPQCLKKLYNMTPKDLPCDWYSSKKAWMNTRIWTEILTKLNAKLRRQNRHIALFVDNHVSHIGHHSNIKLVMLPANATCIVQPLDQGILRSVKCRYRSVLATKYMAVIENREDARAMLKKYNVKQACDIIAQVWKDIPPQLIENCFKEAGFKSGPLAPLPPAVDPPAPVWNRIINALDVQISFRDYAMADDGVHTSAPMTDAEIIAHVRDENEPAPEQDETIDFEPDVIVKTSVQFLEAIDQQRAFLRRFSYSEVNLDKLEKQILEMHTVICSKQVGVKDFFSMKKPELLRAHTILPNVNDNQSGVVDNSLPVISGPKARKRPSHTVSRADHETALTDQDLNQTVAEIQILMPAPGTAIDLGNIEIVESLDEDDDQSLLKIMPNLDVTQFFKEYLHDDGQSTVESIGTVNGSIDNDVDDPDEAPEFDPLLCSTPLRLNPPKVAAKNPPKRILPVNTKPRTKLNMESPPDVKQPNKRKAAEDTSHTQQKKRPRIFLKESKITSYFNDTTASDIISETEGDTETDTDE